MGKPEQTTLPIALGIRDLGKRAGQRLMEIIRGVVRDGGKQEAVAKALGISEPMLSQALSSQRTFNAEWIPSLLAFDHDRKILKHLAWESHCRVEPIDPFDDADYRKAAEVVLRDAGTIGDQLRQLILEAAQQVAQERSR